MLTKCPYMVIIPKRSENANKNIKIYGAIYESPGAFYGGSHGYSFRLHRDSPQHGADGTIHHETLVKRPHRLKKKLLTTREHGVTIQKLCKTAKQSFHSHPQRLSERVNVFSNNS